MSQQKQNTSNSTIPGNNFIEQLLSPLNNSQQAPNVPSIANELTKIRQYDLRLSQIQSGRNPHQSNNVDANLSLPLSAVGFEPTQVYNYDTTHEHLRNSVTHPAPPPFSHNGFNSNLYSPPPNCGVIGGPVPSRIQRSAICNGGRSPVAKNTSVMTFHSRKKDRPCNNYSSELIDTSMDILRNEMHSMMPAVGVATLPCSSQSQVSQNGASAFSTLENEPPVFSQATQSNGVASSFSPMLKQVVYNKVHATSNALMPSFPPVKEKALVATYMDSSKICSQYLPDKVVGVAAVDKSGPWSLFLPERLKSLAPVSNVSDKAPTQNLLPNQTPQHVAGGFSLFGASNAVPNNETVRVSEPSVSPVEGTSSGETSTTLPVTSSQYQKEQAGINITPAASASGPSYQPNNAPTLETARDTVPNNETARVFGASVSPVEETSSGEISTTLPVTSSRYQHEQADITLTSATTASGPSYQPQRENNQTPILNKDIPLVKHSNCLNHTSYMTWTVCEKCGVNVCSICILPYIGSHCHYKCMSTTKESSPRLILTMKLRELIIHGVKLLHSFGIKAPFLGPRNGYLEFNYSPENLEKVVSDFHLQNSQVVGDPLMKLNNLISDSISFECGFEVFKQRLRDCLASLEAFASIKKTIHASHITLKAASASNTPDISKCSIEGQGSFFGRSK